MSDLKVLATKLGLQNPQTYIQSGNLIFGSESMTAAELSARLETAVAKHFGFSAAILLRDADQIAAAIAANPFAAKVREGKELHLYFLDGPSDTFDETALRALASDREEFVLLGDVLYLYAPDGIGRSKLAEKLPKYLPKRFTARNGNSVNAMYAMMAD
jgi:uncharacterized protein (DUF1697 family)